MAIDDAGEWWKGENFQDLSEYMYLLTEGNYKASKVLSCACNNCNNSIFKLNADKNEGCAERICIECNTASFICDSEEVWEDAEPKFVMCPCQNNTFELGIAFALRENSDIRWVYIGQRCSSCGILACCIDWKIGYGDTQHLYENV